MDGVRLRVIERASPLDSRRGVVRLGPEAMTALNLRPWDTVRLVGRRVTGALVAQSPLDSDPRVILCDSLTVRNLGVTNGAEIHVERGAGMPCRSLALGGPEELIASAPPELVRLALMGKVVTRGDEVSLVAQDFTLPPDADPAGIARSQRDLATLVAGDWRAVRLLVVECDPEETGVVTMATSLRWYGGASTATSGSTVLPAPLPAHAGFPAHGGPPAPPSQMPRQWGSPTPGPGGRHGAVPPAHSGGPIPRPRVPAGPPGLSRETAELREWLALDFHHAELLSRLGTTSQLGVLVTGPAGAGKVALVEAASAAVGASVVRVWAPRLAGMDLAAATAELASLTANAAGRAPCVLIVEDVEAVASREQPGPLDALVLDTVRRLVADPRVAVVCTSSRPEAVTPVLREPGLLEREISVPLPTREMRREMLAQLTSGMPLDRDVDLADMAARTPGFVLADLATLCREAALRAAHRHRESERDGSLPLAGSAGGAAPRVDLRPTVTVTDVNAALAVVRPTAARGESLEVPDLTLDDVGDMEQVKQALTEAVLWPLNFPDTFERLGVAPPRGVLMYGPPGCGKTFLVRALAGTGQATVLPVKGAELLSKWVGESERGVRELFRRARESAPCIVFLDEVDALAPARGRGMDSSVSDRVVAALLTELDGIEGLRGVTVLAATNRPDILDPALLRPGRLERLVYVAPPDAEARRAILAAAARKTPLAPDVDLAVLAASTEGFSAADCAALLREAALTAMRASMESTLVTQEHLTTARAAVRPSLNPEMVAELETYADRRSAGS